MTKFLLYGILGLTAGAALGWSYHSRRRKKSAATQLPNAQWKTVKEAAAPVGGDVLGPEAMVSGESNPTVSVSAATDSAMSPICEANRIFPNEVDVASEQPKEQTRSVLPLEIPAINVVPSKTKEANPLPSIAHTNSPVELETKVAVVASGGNFSEVISPTRSNEEDSAVERAVTSVKVPPDSLATSVANEKDEAVQETSDLPHPPTYRLTAPPAVVGPKKPGHPSNRPSQNMIDLRLRVRLVFGRGGVVKDLSLVPDRRDGMPNEIEVTGTQDGLHLTELREDCYEPVALGDVGDALLQGMEWCGRNGVQRYRWVLGGRELYVLAPGDEFGLHGFVSTARLWLNARHVVLATTRLREEVLTALGEAGCATPAVIDQATLGVPPGWLLFRDVTPTCAVPMRDDRDILNSLRPAHEIEPHFVGGIRLVRNTWLAGFPPRIRFTGEFANGFQVKIDGQSAQPVGDGAFEAPGWDSEGQHRLWFGDRAETYSIKTMEEDWQNWHAHNFGTGVAICGANTRQIDSVRRQQVRVPTSNPVLVGSYPGEIFRCDLRNDVRCETILKMIPFTPVWALPLDSAHADKKSARILLFRPAEPAKDTQSSIRNLAASRAWISVIREAGSKGLSIAPDDAQSKALWQRYRIVAKQLRRRMR